MPKAVSIYSVAESGPFKVCQKLVQSSYRFRRNAGDSHLHRHVAEGENDEEKGEEERDAIGEGLAENGQEDRRLGCSNGG